MKNCISSCGLSSSSSPLLEDRSVKGLWECIIDHAELQVVEYLASKQCRSFDPCTSEVARAMLRLVDRSALSCVVKERNYEGLCGRFGCLLKPRLYRQREQSVDVVDWSSIENVDEDIFNDDVEEKEMEEMHTVGPLCSAYDGSVENAEEEDEIVYTEDYYTRESFRLAIKDQERRRRYRCYLEHRRATSHGAKVGGSASPEEVEPESNRPKSWNNPASASAVRASATRCIAFGERFCSDECMEVFELDIKPRIAPYHVEYGHPDMIKTIGQLFPNLRLEVLLQLAHEGRKKKEKTSTSTLENETASRNVGEEIIGEIHEKEIHIPTSPLDVSQMNKEICEDEASGSFTRNALLQSFLNSMKEMRQLWKNGPVVAGLHAYHSAGSVRTTDGTALTTLRPSTPSGTHTSAGSHNRIPCAALLDSPSANSTALKANQTPNGAVHQDESKHNGMQEKQDSLRSSKPFQKEDDISEVILSSCEKKTTPASCFTIPLSHSAVASSPLITDSSLPYSNLGQHQGATKKGSFLVHDFLLNVCGVRCSHFFLAHYAAHREELTLLWDKYDLDECQRLSSRLVTSNHDAVESGAGGSAERSLFWRIANPITQRLEDTLEKMTPQLNAMEPLRVESGLEHQRRQQLAQHLFSAESTATLSRFLLLDECVMASAAWNGVWLSPPPSSVSLPTSTYNKKSSSTVSNTPCSTFHSLLFPFPIPSVLLKPLSTSPESLEMAILFVVAAACVHPLVLKQFLFEDAQLEDIVDVLHLDDDDLEAALRVMLFSYD